MSAVFSLSKQAVSFPCRAKYYPMPDGSLRLASVQQFNTPRFSPSGWEEREKKVDAGRVILPEEVDDLEEGREASVFDVERATRRARKNAFDIIMCNPDLDTFCTFTYAPDAVDDKASYDECFRFLNAWLSNRVQRRGLKYVCVPERTKAGDIHFHAIMNAEALKLVPAFSPRTGRPLTHHGKPLYNLEDWSKGFTTCEPITKRGEGEDEREAVSKYIFKYMGKQAGQKIGGRYCLIGGKLAKPIFAYGESANEFFDGQSACKYQNHKEIDGVVYDEWSYI